MVPDPDPPSFADRIIFANGTLTIASGITIRTDGGDGDIRGNVILNGTLSAESNSNFIFVSSAVTNNGLFRASNGGLISGVPTNLSNGTLTGGRYEVYDGSTINFPSAVITANNANILLSGPTSHFDALNGLTSNGGSFSVMDGRAFTTVGAFSNTGKLAIGPGSAIHVSQDLSEGPSSELDVLIGLSNGDRSVGLLTVAGNTQLDGVLRVSFADGYAPAAGDQFSLQFLSAGTTSGAFSEIDLPALPAGESWVSGDIADGRLTVAPEPSTLAASLIAIGWGISRRRQHRQK